MSRFVRAQSSPSDPHRVGVVEFDLTWQAGRPVGMGESDLALVLKSELMPDLEAVLEQAHARHGDLEVHDIELDLGRFTDFGELSEFRRDFRVQLAQRLDALAADPAGFDPGGAVLSLQSHMAAEVAAQIQRVVLAGFGMSQVPPDPSSGAGAEEADAVVALLSGEAVAALAQWDVALGSVGALDAEPPDAGDYVAATQAWRAQDDPGQGEQGPDHGPDMAQRAAAVLRRPGGLPTLLAHLASQTWRMEAASWPVSGPTAEVSDGSQPGPEERVQAWAAALDAGLSAPSPAALLHVWRVNPDRAAEVIGALPVGIPLDYAVAILEAAGGQTLAGPVLERLRADLRALRDLATSRRAGAGPQAVQISTALEHLARLSELLGIGSGGATGRVGAGRITTAQGQEGADDADAQTGDAGPGPHRVPAQGGGAAVHDMREPFGEMARSGSHWGISRPLMSDILQRVLQAITGVGLGDVDTALQVDGERLAQGPPQSQPRDLIAELRGLFPEADQEPPLVGAVVEAMQSARAPDHFLAAVIAAIGAGEAVDIEALAAQGLPQSQPRDLIAELRGLFPEADQDPPLVEAVVEAMQSAHAPDHFLTAVIAAIRAGEAVDIEALAAQGPKPQKPRADDPLSYLTGLLDGAGHAWPPDVPLPLALAKYKGQIAALLADKTTGPARSARLSGLLTRAQLDRFLDAVRPAATPHAGAALDVLEQVLAPRSDPRNLLAWFRLLLAFDHLPPTGGTAGLIQQALVFFAGNADAARDLARVLSGRLSDPKQAPQAPATPSVAQALAELSRIPQDLKNAKPEPGEVLLTQTSGLTLLNPFVPRLFGELQLTHDGAFAGPQAQMKAVCLLNYAALGHAEGQGQPMPLERLLCGVPQGVEISPQEITDQEAELVQSMLSAFLGHWSALGKTSVDGVREAFLTRDGVLSEEGGVHSLKVAPKTLDILLEKLPWSFSVIKFGWMPEPLHVAWRSGHGG